MRQEVNNIVLSKKIPLQKSIIQRDVFKSSKIFFEFTLWFSEGWGCCTKTFRASVTGHIWRFDIRDRLKKWSINIRVNFNYSSHPLFFFNHMRNGYLLNLFYDTLYVSSKLKANPGLTPRFIFLPHLQLKSVCELPVRGTYCRLQEVNILLQ